MRETTLEVVRVPIDEIKPYDGNAKVHTLDQIDAVERSISEFGFRNPVILWHNDRGEPEVVAGHARVTAAKNLGMREVPCVLADDLTDAQRRALTLADNQTTMMTGWDEEQLAYELDVLADDFDMGDFGFDLDADAEEFQEKLEKQDGLPNIKVSGKTYPISREESDAFVEAMEEWVDREGVSYGFVSHLLSADAR